MNTTDMSKYRYRIIAIHTEPTRSRRYEHITDVKAVRVEHGPEETDPDPITLQTVLNRLAAGARYTCRGNGSEVDVSAYPESAPKFIRTERNGEKSDNLMSQRRF